MIDCNRLTWLIVHQSKWSSEASEQMSNEYQYELGEIRWIDNNQFGVIIDMVYYFFI